MPTRLVAMFVSVWEIHVQSNFDNSKLWGLFLHKFALPVIRTCKNSLHNQDSSGEISQNVVLIQILRLVNVLFPKIIKSIYVSSGNKHEYFFSYFANNWVREIHFKPSLFVDNQKKKASLSKLH